LKVSCYRNYYIDFNQILHNDRDHQVVVVGGPNGRPTNPRWRTAAILKKNVKSPYLCNRSTDFDEIWHDDAHWFLTADLLLKFYFFLFLKIQDGGGSHHEISQTLRYLRNCLTDLYEIWYGGAKWVSLTAQTVTN